MTERSRDFLIFAVELNRPLAWRSCTGTKYRGDLEGQKRSLYVEDVKRIRSTAGGVSRQQDSTNAGLSPSRSKTNYVIRTQSVVSTLAREPMIEREKKERGNTGT